MVEVQGEVAKGFEPVRDAFVANFEQHGEVGAAVCVYKDGGPVVDIWGGVADESTGRPWQPDTTALVFSTTKGATAVCANLLSQRGELDWDAPVRTYWPEFAQEGKESIPVRFLASHRAGLPVVDAKLSFEDVCAWHPVVDALAAQKPIWEPGTAHGYHALTYGNLVGEVVRRISGKTLGTFFATEVAEPLGLDLHIGLPASQESRVAPLIPIEFPNPDQAPEGPMGDQLRLMGNALSLSGAVAVDDFNRPELHAAELPAANAIGTARAIAKMYASLIGDVDGVRILKPDTLEAALVRQTSGPDRVLVLETAFGLGFMLNAPFTPFGGPGSFGHPGAGGSIGWADPDAGLAIAYVMNKMLLNLTGDPRMVAILQAAYSSR